MKTLLKFLIITLLTLSVFCSTVACSLIKPNDSSSEIPVVEGKYLLQNSTTDYKIVVPAIAESDSYEVYAAEELKLFFEESTGVRLSIITDEGLTHSDSGKYFSIGDTELFKSSGLTKDNKLTYNGYQINTKGETIYLNGGSAHGALNATYMMLREIIGYEYFTYETYLVDKGVTEIKLPKFNVSYSPSVEYQQYSHQAAYWDKDYRNRMFMNAGTEIFNNPAGATNGWIHNSFFWFPLNTFNNPDLTETYHPEWYGANFQQLCYNANGNAESYEQMVDHFVEIAIGLIRKKPDVLTLGFSHEDQNVWCTCTTCKEETEKYGTAAGSVIQFLNDAMAKVYELVEADPNLENREYRAMFFAYNPTVNPPAKENADGTYSPVDDSVIMSKGVAVMIAPILSVFYLPYDDEANETYYKSLKGWQACQGSLYLWNYDYSYATDLVPFTLHNSAVQTKKIYLDAGLKGVFHETAYDYRVSAFREYSVYQQTRINWNVDLDLNELTKKYFDAVYGPASNVMLELYNMIRLRQELDYRENITDGVSFSYKLDKAEAFPYGEILTYKALLDRAFDILEEYKKQNVEEYEKWREAIMLETFFPRYFEIQHYGTNYTESQLLELKKSFRIDAEKAGLKYEKLYSTWGI